MQAITGKNGQVKFGANIISNVTEFSIDADIATIDVTSFDNIGGWKDNVADMKEWKGSIKCQYALGSSVGNQQLVAWNAMMDGTPIECIFVPDKTTATKYTGNIIIKSVKIGASVGGKVSEFPIEFVGTGPLTPTFA